MAKDEGIGDPDRIHFTWGKEGGEFRERIAERATAEGKKVSELGRELVKTALLEKEQASLELRELKSAVAVLARRVDDLSQQLEQISEQIPTMRSELQGSVILLGSLMTGAIEVGPEASRAERNQILADYVRRIFGGSDSVDS